MQQNIKKTSSARLAQLLHNCCNSLAGFVLCFIACFILLVIAPLFETTGALFHTYPTKFETLTYTFASFLVGFYGPIIFVRCQCSDTVDSAS